MLLPVLRHQGRRSHAFVIAAIGVLFAMPAQACNQEAFEPGGVPSSDFVVIGRVSNYRAISWLGGQYGKFDVIAEKVLKGEIGKKFSATYHSWTPCCGGVKQAELPTTLPSRRYLIAFVKSKADLRPVAPPDANLPTVYIDACVGAYIMEAPSPFTEIVERALSKKKRDTGDSSSKH